MAYQKVYMNQIHSSSLLSQLSEMWKRDVLCDAVITTGKVDTKAHRLVLVAACPMLQSMDSASIGNKLEVKLSPDINKESVISFLQYLYDGFMTLTEDNIRDIEKIARLLQVNSVTKCCIDFYKVLEETVGQSAGSSQKFLFNTDSAEFKHIRTSDLHRLMQNTSAKRDLESEEISSRKRSKLHNQPTSLSKSSGEDGFQLIQSEHKKNGSQYQERPSVQQSLAVSVASKTVGMDTDTHVINVPDINNTDNSPESPTPHTSLGPTTESSSTNQLDILRSRIYSGSFSKPKPLHKPYSLSSSKTISFNKPKIPHLPVPKAESSQVYKPVKAKDTNSDVTNQWPDKPNSSQSESSPKEVDNQITIEPMAGEHEVMEAENLVMERMDSPKTPSSFERLEASISDRKDHTSASEKHPDADSSHIAAQYVPDLGKVKVEVDPGLEGEGHPVPVDENEEDVSDPEYSHHGDAESSHYGDTEYSYHGDTSQTSFSIDEHGSSWYAQTFKGFYNDDQNFRSPIADHKVFHIPQEVHRENDRNGDRSFIPGRTPSTLPLQLKLIRALGTLKSPVVFLRAIQRKMSGGVKIDVLKDFLIQSNENPDFESLSFEELDSALTLFYNSSLISPDHIRDFPAQISDYLNSVATYSPPLNIESDLAFSTSNSAITTICTNAQLDESRRKKQMTQEDLNKLYESGILSNENPTALQNKVWVELMIYIGGLARQDLRMLEKSHFIFEKDDEDKMYYRLDARCMTDAKKKIKVYEQPENLNCPVRSLWLYLSKLSTKSEWFFQQPLKDVDVDDDEAVWYSHRPIGKNAHSIWLATICKEAGITTEYKNQALYCRAAPVKWKFAK